MQFNISNEDKRSIIEGNVAAAERILYSELIHQGVDPEEFNESFFDENKSPEDLSKFSRLKDVYDNYIKVQEMLNNI